MISIVTITYNNFEELIQTVNSLKDAKGSFEHIIVNGGSCSKTIDFLKNEFKGRFLSEPDSGISDAFNKGLRLSTGAGVLFLNSGDVLVDKEYPDIADKKLKEFDFVYADIFFNDPLAGKIVFKGFKNLGRGMPYPHMTLVVRKSIFDKVGEFSLKYKIAMDFDFVCRMHNLNPKGFYYEAPVALMDGGGISTTRVDEAIKETLRALKSNNLWTYSNQLSFAKRLLLYRTRNLLLSLGLKDLVIFIKRKLRK